jgi:arylsulfatase A-like enzyme
VGDIAAQVGEVLAELDALGLADDTAVSFVGDHGQQVGEHNLWEKMTNFELGVRSPIITH